MENRVCQFKGMWFKVANLHFEMEGNEAEVLRFRPNLRPFLSDGAPSRLFHMSHGHTLAAPEGIPDVEEHINGKHIRIWLSAEGYDIGLSSGRTFSASRLHADHDWKQIETDLAFARIGDYETLNDFLMLAFTYSAAFARTVLVHASCVAVGDEGAAFIGRSGAGKSTHSRLWLRHVPGCRLLNDDQPAVQISPVGEIRIFGTPWSGKTPCYRQDSARLMAFFRMRQAEANRLVRPDSIEAFRLLLESASMIGRDSHTFEAITRTLAEIVSRVPVYVLENRPEEAAVRLSSGQVFTSKPLR